MVNNSHIITGINTSKQSIQKANVIEALSETPLVATACKRVGVSRATYYRWLEKDAAFRGKAIKAIAQGSQGYSDIAQSKLLSLVQEGIFQAIKYWLSSRDPDFNPNIKKITLHEEENAGYQPRDFHESALQAEQILIDHLKSQGLKQIYVPIDIDEKAIGAVADPFYTSL